MSHRQAVASDQSGWSSASLVTQAEEGQQLVTMATGGFRGAAEHPSRSATAGWDTVARASDE